MSQVTQSVLAPDHPEGDEGGLDDVGGESHDGVHPQGHADFTQIFARINNKFARALPATPATFRNSAFW